MRRFSTILFAIAFCESPLGAIFRSNFIVGYPGETEEDHDELLAFVADVRLDWCGFFAFSEEVGTHAEGLDGAVPATLVVERLRELGELQDAITASKRDALIGCQVKVLVDEPGWGRTYREAPEIDGLVAVPADLPACVLAAGLGGCCGAVGIFEEFGELWRLVPERCSLSLMVAGPSVYRSAATRRRAAELVALETRQAMCR